MGIKNTLHHYFMKLGNNPRLALIRMIQGGLLFTFGVIMIMVSDQVLTASLSQEIIAFIGLAIAACGVLWTIFGYLSMSVFRIYNMIKKKD